MTGSMVFNWKAPDCAAIKIVASFPATWAQIMATASGITGFTFPGMMLLPGCRAAREISASPATGPLFMARRSLAIFSRDTDNPRSWALSSREASWLLMLANRLRLGVKGRPEASAIRLTTFAPNRGSAFSPVPIAVPPRGSSKTRGSADSMRSAAARNCASQPPNSWLIRIGTASIR